MGQLAVPETGPVYVDANVLIYQVEKIEPYCTAAAPLWDALDAGQVELATSQLSVLEALVKPLALKDQSLINLYTQVLLGTAGLDSIAISVQILRRAAQLRADHKLRTPDAVHAATGLEINCTAFITNDTSFRKVPGLNVVFLQDIIAS